ncbi:MAG: CHAT domain-containing protein [Rhizonema sp. PD37]|nr:CHAT domain-containing protein [Rhizonema sp. PD37]
MRSYKIGLSVFITLLTVLSTSLTTNLPVAFTASQVLAQTVNERKAEADRLLQQGIQQYKTSQFQAALQSWQQALIIYREIKERQSEGKALGNLGLAYLSLGNYAKAIEYEQQVLAIAREIKDHQSEGKALGNLGLTYYSLGNYAKAIEYSQQVLAIAREIKDRQSEGAALGNLGLAYVSLGNYAKAIEYQQQSLAIAREIKDRQSEGIALNNLGYTLYKEGNFADSEKTLFEGINVFESLRGELNDTNKVSIFETQLNTYGTLQQVLIAQNKTDIALEIAERGRARAFVELLASHLNSQIKLKTPTLQEIKQIALVQKATLVQYSIIYDDFKIAGKQQVKESELYIWVIKPTGEVTFRKADLKPLWQKDNTNLDELAIASRESIGVRGRGGVNVVYNPNVHSNQNQFKRLHELLIKPIADLLPKKESDRVIFIPQSSLFLVPFSALQDENGKYLMEKHTILTSPSIQVLSLTHQQRKGSGKSGVGDALVIGNPTMPYVSLTIGEPPQQLPPLPGAQKEAMAIAPLLKTQPLIGDQATKAVVLQRLPSARIVHFATHGILDDVQGLNSSIAFAPNPSVQGKKVNQDDNGLLTASEILDLKLNAELVVLSACDTGRGRITGDGVIGLSRSLISAGTPSVVVSLWAISDDSTAFLMSQFYQNLQQNLDKATALRKAMLATKQKYGNPSQWAAFTLIGEAE